MSNGGRTPQVQTRGHSRVGLITLGCDKNTVDSERYLGELTARGAEYTPDLTTADVILVNTCGFIDAAKKESVDAILQAAELKRSGACRAVVAVGCMVERHRAELSSALPEVDLFIGAADSNALIPELVARKLISDGEAHPGERVYAGDLPHVRYLKISEGCDHGCAFCAIPLMRGKHRSFALSELVREAQMLELAGARELNLVAQDLAHYGRDLRNGTALPELLKTLIAETGISWLRLLYLYSSGITPALLDVLASNARILRYLDMPIQHGSDAVLTRMRRPERRRTILARVAALRDALPDVTIRTTCIVGFPGETEDEFDELLSLLEQVQFDRVGAFMYSPQEGTRAAGSRDDVPETLKRERLERLTETQRVITASRYGSRIGSVARALVDRREASSGRSEARLPWQADDIDGVTYLDEVVPAGSFAEVAVRDVVDDYDFAASVVRVEAREDRRRTPRRILPLASFTAGSYGR